MLHGATIDLRAQMAAAAQEEEFNKAAEIKNKIAVIEVGAMRKYTGTDAREERAELLHTLSVAVQRHEFELAASLKSRIEDLDRCIEKEDAKKQAQHNIDNMSSDPGAAANFLDDFLNQQMEPTDPGEKKKKKKKKRKKKKDRDNGEDQAIEDKDELVLDMTDIGMESSPVRARTQSQYDNATTPGYTPGRNGT